MAVPKRKRSRARRDSRFANKGLKAKSFKHCSHCQAPLASHQACKSCGFYKGSKIFTTKAERILKRSEQKSKVSARKDKATDNQESAE